MKKFYIAYDGRAELGDTDCAQVLEALGRQFTRASYSAWRDTDAVLVEYDQAPDKQGCGKLTNERIIGHWRQGFKALKAQCASHE